MGNKNKNSDTEVSSFWISKYEITWEIYNLFMEFEDNSKLEFIVGNEKIKVDGISKPTTPYTDMTFGMGYEGFPAVNMTHNAASKFCKWLSLETGNYYRLPTEAEWEYAARGGLVGKRYPLGDELTDDDANWMNTMIGKDQWKYCSPVGSFVANGYGLYDMVGNAFEWCADWYSENYYSQSPVDNPQGTRTGEFRVVRGGFWSNYESILWLSFRDGVAPFNKIDDLGFRCVVAVPTTKSD